MERLVKAFWNSCAGIGVAYRSEAAIRQEIFVLFMALPLVFVLAPGVWQGVAMIGSVLLVLAVELLNTCAEKLCDHVTPDRHPQIKAVKDMGSAAVLCSMCIAALVWLAGIAERIGLF